METSNQSNTKRQLPTRPADAIREVDLLVDGSYPPQKFFEEYIRLIVSGCNAIGGVVWLSDVQGHLRIASEVNWGQIGILENPDKNQKNGQLVGQVAGTGQALFVHSEGSYADQRPGPYSIALAPMLGSTGVQGVLEIFFPENLPDDSRKEFVQYSEQMAGYACVYLASQNNDFVAMDAPGFWNRFEPFLLELHNELDTKLVAGNAANDSRQLLGVDRVSIAIYEGRKIKIVAVSGQDSINRRANVIRLLSRLTKVLLPSQQIFQYDGTDQDRAPQVESVLGEYLQEAGSRVILIVPLYEVKKRDELRNKPKNPNAKQESPDKKMIGAMIIEQMKSSRLVSSQTELSNIIADHVGNALGKAKSHEDVFLLPVWRTIGRGWAWLKTRPLWKTSTVIGVITALVLLLTLLPWSYRIEGDGRLMPVIQWDVFAPELGKVKTIFVKSGQKVTAGQKLLQLTNKKLESDYAQISSDLSQKRLKKSSLTQEFNNAYKDNREEESLRIDGEIVKTEIEIKSLLKEEYRLKVQVESLLITSPIDGVIATFQVRKNLRDRPVNRGDVLMEIMDPSGEWHLELAVEDKRMGHLIRARDKNKDKTLPVEFILATDVEQTFEGTLSQLGTRTNVHENEGNMIELFVSPMDKSKLPKQRIGAEVKAKIDCGKKKLGYVLFGDVIDFIRIRLWI